MNDSDNGDSNIYSGLPEFRYDETLDKLHATVAKLEAENGELQRKLDLMKKDKESLESNFKILSTNLSSLLKTARTEVSRKDRTIDDLRKQLNEILPQRKRFSIKRRTDDAVEVTSRKRFCHENGRSSHYIRKPEFHVEDVVKEASISVDALEKQQPRLETLGGYCPPARPEESLPSINKKPLPVKDAPLPEDGNCLPPPLNCPTVFSARMYRRMYNVSAGVAPDPPVEISFAPNTLIETRDKPVLNESSSPLVPEEVTTKLPYSDTGDQPVPTSRTQLAPPKSSSSIVRPTTSLKGRNCANISDKNSDSINISVQPSTDSFAQCNSRLASNVESFSQVVSGAGRSQSELTFSVRSQGAEQFVDEPDAQNILNLPNPPRRPEELSNFDVKADLRLSDSECSLSNPAVTNRVPSTYTSNVHPVTKEPKNTNLNESSAGGRLEDFRRRKNPKTNRNTGLKKSSPKKFMATKASPTCVKSNGKLKFTPISSTWVCSKSSKNDLPEEPKLSPPCHEPQKANELPTISVTSELKVTIEEALVNETKEELLFGSPLKWTEDSCDSVKNDHQQTSKETKMCSIFGSPLKIVDSGSSDVLNFLIPQNAYEDSCWTQQSSLMKDVRPSRTSPSTQELSSPVTEEQGKDSAETPRAKSIFSPSKDSKSSYRPISCKMGDQAESSIGLSFPFKSGPKYGDSVLGHYDDTAQFVSALAKDETELSPLSTPSKSDDFVHPCSSGKVVPSSFKEIFVNNGKENATIQLSVQPQDAPCEKSMENCSESDKKLGDATKNEIDGSPDQGVPSTSSVVLENHSLSSNITLRMITPANLASSTILCPTQSRSNASVNRLEPRKTPRIVVRSSNVALKKIETDIPKIALDDEFVAQQEKRWMNSSRSSKKSSGRNSALAGSPSPKKGYKTTISPAIDVVEKPTDSNLEPSEKEGPISVSKIQSVGEEFGSLNVDRTDATSSKVEVPNGESGVENSETPQNNCNKENSVRKSLANLDSTETYVQPHETLEASAEDHEIPGEQCPDLKSKDVQTSAVICGNSLNIDSSVAKKDTAVSVSPHQLKARGKMDSVELKNTSEYAKSSKPQKGHVKVFDKSTTSNAIVRVESPGKVKASRESSILKPIVSSVNVPSKIVIKKAGRRNKDFKKSSALKEVSQRRTTRLAGLFNASKEKEVFTPSSKIRAQTETQITPERLESDSRRKSESDFSSKRENLVSRRAGCSPEILHIYSRDERDDAKNHCHEKPIPSSLSPLLNEETSKRESGSITSVPRRLPPKSILGERSGSNSFPQTGASDVSRIRLVDSVSKRPKRVWGKSETHSNSICVSEETCGKRSDELTPPKPLIFMRKSSDCNFSPRTSASVSVEHEPHCDLRKHELSGPVNTGRPAMWPPRRIDLDTVGNIYNCITSSFSPDDPRACRELSKMQKTIVHVCGIDWNPDAAEKLATSEMAESPKLLKLDVSAISPTGEKRKRAITVITSTPINRTEDPNLQESPFALRSKSFGHSVELNSEKPPSGMEHRMVTRNRGRRTILLSSPLERRTGRPPREKRPSPALSGSPKENYSSRLLEVKRRKNPTDRPKSSKHTRETVESSKMLISPRSLRNVDRLRGEEIPACEPKKLQTSPAENTLKPKLISLKPRNVNFSSFSASSSSSKVIYVGRNEASFRSND